jgi:hypothetical protein
VLFAPQSKGGHSAFKPQNQLMRVNVRPVYAVVALALLAVIAIAASI